MAHNARVRPPGFWTPNSVLLPAEMEQIDQAQFLEIHEGGGTWALQGNVVIGAEGPVTWTFTAPVIFSGAATPVVVQNAGLQVQSAGLSVVAKGTLWTDPSSNASFAGPVSFGGATTLTENTAFNAAKGSQIVLGNGAKLVAAGGALIDIQESGTLTVEAGARLEMSGLAEVLANAQVAFASQALLTMLPGSQTSLGGSTTVTGAMTFQSGAQIVLASGAQASVQAGSLLNFVSGSNITGLLTCPSGTQIVLESSGPPAFATELILDGPQSTLEFRNGASIRGTPMFGAPVLFLNDVTFQGATKVQNQATTIRTGPESRQGPDAVTELRIGTGPNSDWKIDAESYDVVLLPEKVTNTITWSLTAPNYNVEFEILQAEVNQGGSVSVMWGTTQMGLFVGVAPQVPAKGVVNRTAFPGCVKFQWDGKNWRIKSYTDSNSTFSPS